MWLDLANSYLKNVGKLSQTKICDQDPSRVRQVRGEVFYDGVHNKFDSSPGGNWSWSWAISQWLFVLALQVLPTGRTLVRILHSSIKAFVDDTKPFMNRGVQRSLDKMNDLHFWLRMAFKHVKFRSRNT